MRCMSSTEFNQVTVENLRSVAIGSCHSGLWPDSARDDPASPAARGPPFGIELKLDDGCNPLFVLKQHGWSVITMLTIYAHDTQQPDVSAIHAAMNACRDEA